MQEAFDQLAGTNCLLMPIGEPGFDVSYFRSGSGGSFFSM